MNETSTKEFTREASWPMGLYLRRTGVYYARFSMNGSRTFRSLVTDNFAVAKLKLARRQSTVEEDRQKGVQLDADCRTMGGLATLFEAEIQTATVSEGTKENYRNWLLRLRNNWPGGFETSAVRNIDRQFIATLRDQLANRSKFRVVRTHTVRVGYKPAVVNQSLNVLRMLLDLAVQKHAIVENPFSGRGVIQQSLYLPKKHRVPVIPSTADMERVFAEMARVPSADTVDLTSVGEAARIDFLRSQAQLAAEHARFLAYSGMRLEEANACTVADDGGNFIRARGTKTDTADRKVPVIPALRSLLDHIKGRKIAGKLLDVKSSRQALQRACKRLGLPKLRHHDLRHYFITVAVESGASIPAVADWVGHTDGGALLLKTYRHLRDKHSLEEASKVNFSADLSSLSTAGSKTA
jgi:integrase